MIIHWQSWQPYHDRLFIPTQGWTVSSYEALTFVLESKPFPAEITLDLLLELDWILRWHWSCFLNFELRHNPDDESISMFVRAAMLYSATAVDKGRVGIQLAAD